MTETKRPPAPCWRCNPHGTEPPQHHAEWCPDRPGAEPYIRLEPTAEDYYRAHRAIGCCPEVCLAKPGLDSGDWCDACNAAWDRLECASAVAGEFVVERQRAAEHLRDVADREDAEADGLGDPKGHLAMAKRLVAVALQQEAAAIERGRCGDHHNWHRRRDGRRCSRCGLIEHGPLPEGATP